MNPKEAKEYMEEDQFGKTSMLPKIESSIDFISSAPGRRAIIAHLEHAREAVLGRSGTVISFS